MAAISGTNLAAGIVPFTTDDNFPTHEDIYGKGGLVVVDDEAEMLATKTSRLKEGMLFYDIDAGNYYKLNGSWSTPLVIGDFSEFDFVESVNGETGTVVLTTGDIAEDADHNYVTDAQQTVLGNTSGTNTGDLIARRGEMYIDELVVDPVTIDFDYPFLFDGLNNNSVSGITSYVGARGSFTAVVTDGGNAKFTTSSAHPLETGDMCYITDGPYVGTFEVLTVADTTHFTLDIAYASNESGTYVRGAYFECDKTGVYEISYGLMGATGSGWVIHFEFGLFINNTYLDRSLLSWDKNSYRTRGCKTILLSLSEDDKVWLTAEQKTDVATGTAASVTDFNIILKKII